MHNLILVMWDYEYEPFHAIDVLYEKWIILNGP